MYAQWVILAIGFAGFVGLSIVIPVLPHYASSYGASAFGAALAFGIAAAAAMVANVFWGRLSDQIGRKPIVMISLVGQGAAFLWLALAGSLPEIYAARALEGIFVGSNTALFAAMTDITDESRRAGALGRLTAAFTAGFIVGPVLGGLLATAFGDEPRYDVPFLFTAGLFFTLAVLAWFALPESRDRKTRAAARGERQSVWRRIRVYAGVHMAVPLLGSTTVSFASNSTSAIFALWALDRFGWGVVSTSWAIMAMAAFVVIWNLFAGLLTRAVGRTGLLLWTQAGMTLAFVALVYVQSPVFLYVVLAVAAFGNGLGRTAAISAVSVAAEPDRRGEAMGVQGMLSSAATTGGPLLAGWLFVTLAPGAPFAVIAAVGGVVFVVTALYVAWWRTRR